MQKLNARPFLEGNYKSRFLSILQIDIIIEILFARYMINYCICLHKLKKIKYILYVLLHIKMYKYCI